MPRKPQTTDNTEVQQLLLQFDIETNFYSLPSFFQDLLIAACRSNLSSTEDLPDEHTAFFLFKALKQLDEISTNSVQRLLSERGMGNSERNAQRWASRLRYATDAILYHGEQNFLQLNGKETDIYIDVDNCFTEFPDDPNNPAPSYSGQSESSPLYVAEIKREGLEDVLKDIEGRYKGKPKDSFEPIDRHVWNLRNGYEDRFLQNAFKHIVLMDDEVVIIDKDTGEYSPLS